MNNQENIVVPELNTPSQFPSKSMDWKHDLTLRGIKLLDICFITTIYFLAGTAIAKFIDKIIGKFDKEKEDKKTTLQILIETIAFLSFIGIVIYILRNLVELIPFPLDGWYGFQHKKVKELGGGIILGFSILFYQKYLRAKLDYFFTRVNF
jgi:hypothetical protein